MKTTHANIIAGSMVQTIPTRVTRATRVSTTKRPTPISGLMQRSRIVWEESGKVRSNDGVGPKDILVQKIK